MAEFTPEMTLREVRKTPEFADFAPFIMFCNEDPADDPVNPGKDPEDFTMKSDPVCATIDGLTVLRDNVRKGIQVAYDIYTDDEKAKEPDKDNTKLFFFPGKPGKPFMLVCAGGGYATVCSFLEGFPVAARLNRMGYNAFVLSYRVNEVGLLPKPTEDVAAALRLIFANADKFQVSTENYAVAGFSAGGHVTGSWGTNYLGYPRFGMPKPALLVLAYGASKTKADPGNFFFRSMVGDNPDPEMVKAVDITANVTPDYPATFLWQCKDDPLVPFEAAEAMDKALETAGVPHRFMAFEKGGHGIGLGDNTDAAGWLDHAVEFWETVSK